METRKTVRTIVSLSGSSWRVGEGTQPAAWIEAHVPGNIQEDLWRAGEKPDPYVGTNAEAYRDCEDRTWTYELRFDHDAAGAGEPGLAWVLQLDGVDYKADFFLNGTEIGHHEGMYGRIELDVTGLLKRKANDLRVLIHPLVLAPRDSRAVVDPLAPLRHDGRWMAKSLMSFFWDFAPRLVPTGIWKDVRLIGTRGVRLHSPCMDCELSRDNTSAVLSFTVSAWSAAAQDVVAVIELFEPDAASPALTCREPVALAAGENELVLAGALAAPRLWWPNGLGDPFLYRAVMRLEKGREVTDEISFDAGIRTVRMIRTPRDQAEEIHIPASSQKNETTLVVNGLPVAYRGINIAPMDILYGRIDDARISAQMSLVRDAHLNLLRIWGGGIVNRDSFYELADRYGIMLWQEFPLGCTDHEGNAHYRGILEQEARSMVRSLRRHPSLVIWCGGNELFMPQSGMGPQDGTVRMLGSVAWTLDPGRIFLPSSPYPGVFHGPYTFDCFGQGGYGSSVDHVQFFNTAPDGAYNECGVAGPSLPSLIRASAPAAEVWPPKRGGVWEFHKAFGTWGDGNTWLLPELIERYFGPVSRLEDLCRAGQFLQAIGIQYLLEEMRRRWPNVPGVMPWCFNTPWTSFAGSFVVAYPDSPLPAYYALQKAYAPRSVSARLQSFVARPGETVRIGVHVLNDGGAPVGPGSVQMEAGPIGGKPWVRRTLDAPGVQTMGRAVLGDVSIGVPASFEGVITIALRWRHAGGEETNRSYIGVAAEPATGSAAEPATGVAAGTAPAACFRPLIDLWEKDPSMRMAAME